MFKIQTFMDFCQSEFVCLRVGGFIGVSSALIDAAVYGEKSSI